MRTFVVFNAEQTSGLQQFRVGFAQPKQDTGERHEHADSVIESTGATIRTAATRRSTRSKAITSNCRTATNSRRPKHFTKRAFHELVHWTEHPARLNWDRAE